MPRLERTYHDLSRPVREFTFVVDLPEEGMRLDALLRSHYPWKSRTHYQRMLHRGDVLVDGRSGKASARVRKGMRVVVKIPVDPAAPEQESADDLVFLYEDDAIAAIDKPSGMTAHPTGRTRHGTLINKLHARYRDDDATRDVVPRLGHRIDRDTSGVVLVVKNRRVDALVTEAFTNRRVEKTYLALVTGVPEPEGVVDAPLGPDPGGSSRMHQAVRPDGQPARSRWRVLRAFARHALVELKPETGRTHQLRVHMAHAGFPVACDHLYGDLRPLLLSDGTFGRVPPCEDAVILARLALHSHRLVLDHPVTGTRLAIESRLPQDLKAACEELERPQTEHGDGA